MLFSNYNFLPFMPFQEDQNSGELAPQPGKFSVLLYISYISTSFLQISFSLILNKLYLQGKLVLAHLRKPFSRLLNFGVLEKDSALIE